MKLEPTMRVDGLAEELELCLPDSPVFVEVDGELHEVSRVCEDSQGAYLIVDQDAEERLLR